ncbi:TIGR02302 family protein [Aliiruegeria lutimaris]|uniref:TIGR02302 family protein n=1 Tax=Aliiruegeria lutimaris TaxID=571298 RepID=A0A1G8P668_9RHOB|nr:TIGR02302 family protein [Aliiruegeria lutimaris]SDI88001.1 TIGR02302 family protein [Aliiruegeria lutimaris]
MARETARNEALERLNRPLRLTRLGMAAERFTRCFWPVWSILFAVFAVLMLGLHETAPVEAVWIGALLSGSALLVFLFRGLRWFRWPSRAEAWERLDSTLPGRPLQALSDDQAIGSGDAASEAVWAAHLERMAARAAKARRVAPDLRISGRDPYALRYVALTALVTALLFGSVWKISTVGQAVAPGAGGSVAAGPSWEGWIEPPAYTGKPSLYLADIAPGPLDVPRGSRVSLRLYGEVGALSVDETISGRAGNEIEPATAAAQGFDVMQGGRLAINGPGGREWAVSIAPDRPPSVEPDGEVEREASGRMSQKFRARDDYGVTAGRGVIALDTAEVVRRFGLVVDPDPREPIEIDLPMTISGDRSDFTETLVEDFSKHPWVGLPVTLTLMVSDASGQEGSSVPMQMALPGKRFFDPLAAAIIEQRRDLLWSRSNGKRVAQVIRAVTHRPDEIIRDGSTYLPLRVALRRLEAGVAAAGGLSTEIQEEIAEALWDIAVKLEDGNLADAAERLRRAQDRLAEAMRNGATNEEIAELMDELRQAMQDYMRQLAQQQDPNQQPQMSENTQTITGDQLQQLLDRLQQLMEEGRTAEAMQLLEQLRQMMENMQVTQGQQGQQGQNPGDQAMQGLSETLRDQQGLSDEAFRDLQEQFNPGQQPQTGESGQNQGSQGDMGQGRDHEGQQGQGQAQGQQDPEGQPRAGENGQPDARTLAERQRQLQRRLDDLRQNLPGAGTEPGDAAREALRRGSDEMGRAEESLENNQLAEALDSQARAMEAIRDGMRSLGEAMAQQQQSGQGQQTGQANSNSQRDPLGREAGTSGSFGSEDSLLQGDDIYRKARDLLDEIRRRSGERERPQLELDYLRRLLDRF